MEDRDCKVMSVGEVIDSGRTILGRFDMNDIHDSVRWPYVEDILEEYERAYKSSRQFNCGKTIRQLKLFE